MNREKPNHLGQWELKYLGHVLFLVGVAVDPKKIEEMPTPSNIIYIRGIQSLDREFRLISGAKGLGCDIGAISARWHSE
ncbi:uncharacterized protein VTP21DRAFT_1936 [Calcarisporiella thermophila]|uniref:uncharacterized protein n=1 Tax=Calcarisporiella thermophila TaxID=911321 RepID=UPI00374203B7